jgi:hypothetical protein
MLCTASHRILTAGGVAELGWGEGACPVQGALVAGLWLGGSGREVLRLTLWLKFFRTSTSYRLLTAGPQLL